MIKILPAEEKDIPLIRNLAEESWKAAYQGIISEEQIAYMLQQMYSAEEISAQFRNPDYRYDLIFENEKAVGFMGFEHDFEEDTTKLHRIYLLSEVKGKGLGKTALQSLKEKVADRGNRRIILAVNKANPARNMYLSQGFKVYSEGIFDIGNGFVMDDYLMEFIF